MQLKIATARSIDAMPRGTVLALAGEVSWAIGSEAGSATGVEGPLRSAKNPPKAFLDFTMRYGILLV
jgi:hypothetical protein